MAIEIEDLKRWLSTLPEDGTVAIDEGGLTMVCLENKDAYIELGGGSDMGPACEKCGTVLGD
jgi:hypothetical protein